MLLGDQKHQQMDGGLGLPLRQTCQHQPTEEALYTYAVTVGELLEEKVFSLE